MFSMYSWCRMGSVGGFANDMAALDLKEAAQRLQMHGNFAQALPLMLESVAMRECSHTLCLSLSELAELYLDMLKLDEAQETCYRMMREAHRYDKDQQIRIAEEILGDVREARKTGLVYGACVQVHGLVQEPRWNGQRAVVRGRLRSNGRYCIDTGSSMISAKRQNVHLAQGVAESARDGQGHGSVGADPPPRAPSERNAVCQVASYTQRVFCVEGDPLM